MWERVWGSWVWGKSLGTFMNEGTASRTITTEIEAT